MIIVIDGYNVLKQVIHDRDATDIESRAFIDQLCKYAKSKKHKLIVVFDGGPTERPTQEQVKGLYIVYSGYQETADDYIKRYLKDKKARDILLVSSDREINAVADRLDIVSIDAADFYYIVRQETGKKAIDTLNKESPAIKTKKDYQPELDILMEQSSRQLEPKTEDISEIRKKEQPKKLSKKERKLIATLKKL